MAPPPNIDDLLANYLTLLDEYTTLRTELSRLQTATFQHLARANFAAERGMRFGPDYYDERMQAQRRVQIVKTTAETGLTFQVVKTAASEAETQTETAAAAEQDEKQDADAAKTEKPKKTQSKDPIRWFGLLTPPALRQTQASAVEAVERVIPKLLTVEAEMRRVEIEVRRARKRRAKAEVVAPKEQDGVQSAAREEVAAS